MIDDEFQFPSKNPQDSHLTSSPKLKFTIELKTSIAANAENPGSSTFLISINRSLSFLSCLAMGNGSGGARYGGSA
jgi:hypothetical protein